MTDSFTCPFCQSSFPLINSTSTTWHPTFEGSNTLSDSESKFKLRFMKCPKCGEYTVYIQGIGEKVKSETPINIHPISNAKQFPEYIPKAIIEDYKEAYAIINLSPKSSATLARRCLQGMIHDFWGIYKKNLNAEITELQSYISPNLWKVLDGVRSIGNIGAHMEHDINKIVDIDSREAERLIKLIEYLIKEWYINRHEQDELFSDIIGIAQDKENKRKGNE